MNALKYCVGKKGQGQVIPLATKTGISRIDLSSIYYFEKELRKIHIHGRRETWTYYGKMNELEAVLDNSFCRCHNAIIVNLMKVRCLERFHFCMEDGRELLVSQKRYTQVKNQYWEFLNGLSHSGGRKI